MIKHLTCIECPVSCRLEVDIENGKVVDIKGNKCPKGVTYGRQEIENPMRILTTTILAKNMEVKLVPVRTSSPIPKEKLLDAISEIRKIVLDRPVQCGEIIRRNLLGLGVDVIATRSCK